MTRQSSAVSALALFSAALFSSVAANAQTQPAPAQQAPEISAPAAIAQAGPAPQAGSLPPEPATVEALPADPLALAQALLGKAKLGEQCRYMFTQSTMSGARVGWSSADVDAQVKFDPRLPIGARWSVVRANKQSKAIAKSLAKEDKKGLPSDLISLLPEGEFTLEGLAVSDARADVATYSFTPSIIAERSSNETGAKIVAQLLGVMEVDRSAGRIQSITLRTPEEGVRSGIAKLKSATMARVFAQAGDGHILAERVVQTASASALLSSAEITSTTGFNEIVPICDPGEVAAIQAAEAAARVKKK